MRERETCESRNGAPAAVAVGGDVVDELLIFLGGPKPSLHFLFIAAAVI